MTLEVCKLCWIVVVVMGDIQNGMQNLKKILDVKEEVLVYAENCLAYICAQCNAHSAET